MRAYSKPLVHRLDHLAFLFVKTQQTGFPTDADCSFLTCFASISADSATFDITWQDPDNDGSDIGGYIVNIEIDGEPFNNLQDSLPTCDVTFAAGTFTLSCSNFFLNDTTCDGNPDTLVVVSIEDPQENVLSPTGASCQFALVSTPGGS